MTTKLLLAGALIALLILPAGAQQAPQGTPTRIRGTVEKLDGQALMVKSREGQGCPPGRGALERNAPNLFARYFYQWEPTVVRQAIKMARVSVSSGGHSSSY